MEERLAGELRVWRALTAIFALLSLVLLAVLYARTRGVMGWEISVDGKPVCLVPSEEVAESVRKRIIADAVGDTECKAAIKERWTVKPPQILDAEKAYQKLKDKVHVLVEAYAIEVDGKPVVYLPSESAARQVLAMALERFAQSGQGELVGKPRFREDVRVVQRQVEASKIIRDPKQALEKLLSGGQKYYTVQKGDYPAKIAKKFGLTLAQLYQMNPGIRNKDLRAGQKLVVATTKPRVTVVTVRELTVHKPIPPPEERVETLSLPPGQTKVASPGEPGEKILTLRATFENERRVKAQILKSKVVKPPKPRKILVGAKRPSSPQSPVSRPSPGGPQ